MRQLNKAETFALQTAQGQLAEADARAVALRQQFHDLVAACGLNPAVNYQLSPEGTVTEMPPVISGTSSECPEESKPA